jgi:ribonucleoside-diphosphate reductase beta chain
MTTMTSVSQIIDDFKNDGSNRYTIFPIKYPKLWEFYEQQLSVFWTVAEVKLTDDITDWDEKLNDNEKYFIKNILAFFAASDGIVNENLVLNFYNEVQIPEARNFYAVQMMIEAIHSQQYSLLIDTYVRDKNERYRLFNAIENVPCIKKKADWALKWIEEGTTTVETLPDYVKSGLSSLNERTDLTDDMRKALQFFTKKRPSFGQRLIAFICVEGIFFAGSFCAIYWLKNRGLMPGLSTANEFISRDENTHTEFAIELYKLHNQQLNNEKIDESTVHRIVKDAVDIEKEFVTESLPVSLIGMNCTLMKEYIEYIADRWLILLGYSKIYNSKNPFTFMEMISLNSKSNFFEVFNSNYLRANSGATEDERQITFDSDDF